MREGRKLGSCRSLQGVHRRVHRKEWRSSKVRGPEHRWPGGTTAAVAGTIAAAAVAGMKSLRSKTIDDRSSRRYRYPLILLLRRKGLQQQCRKVA